MPNRLRACLAQRQLCGCNCFTIAFVIIDYDNCGVWVKYCKSGYIDIIDYASVCLHKCTSDFYVQKTVVPFIVRLLYYKIYIRNKF